MYLILRLLVLQLAALALPHAALAQTESFTVVLNGVSIGHLNVKGSAGRVAIDYDYKNNGRGPTIAETLTLDASGRPVQWTIDGATTFGNKVSERFAVNTRRATTGRSSPARAWRPHRPGNGPRGSFTYHRELELFQRLGMTPAEILSRATLEMARYLGQDQQLGSIERGKLADFFLIPGDPTSDLKATKTIRMVVKDGVVYFPSEIYPRVGIKPFADAPAVTRAR